MNPDQRTGQRRRHTQSEYSRRLVIGAPGGRVVWTPLARSTDRGTGGPPRCPARPPPAVNCASGSPGSKR